eukprot:8085717-Pyramimonas_sp.AAC.1
MAGTPLAVNLSCHQLCYIPPSFCRLPAPPHPPPHSSLLLLLGHFVNLYRPLPIWDRRGTTWGAK